MILDDDVEAEGRSMISRRLPLSEVVCFWCGHRHRILDTAFFHDTPDNMLEWEMGHDNPHICPFFVGWAHRTVAWASGLLLAEV